jgi:hypothetical protein
MMLKHLVENFTSLLISKQVISVMVVTEIDKYTSIWAKTEPRLDICHTTRGSHAERH